MPAVDSIPDLLLGRLTARAEALPVRGRRLLVGLSGGLDSIVLLHLLARISLDAGFALEAAHVHHGLNSHADDWLAHCRHVCAALGVRLHECRVAVTASGKGLEAAAREARHAALAAIPCDWIVLAHHRGDQAETLLHRLLRGAGVHGAGAMRDQDRARRLWRPLLDEPRSVLLAWAQSHGLTWIEDDSNADVSFTRNRLRHEILPLLAAHFGGAEGNLARAARHFGEGAQLLDELAAIDAESVQPTRPGSRERMRLLSDSRSRNLLRHMLAQTGARMPDSARLDDALRQLRSDAAVRLPMDAAWLCAYRDRIWLEHSVAPARPVVWQGESALPWAGGWIRFAEGQAGGLALAPGCSLGMANGRDRLRPHAGGPSRSFRLLCQEGGIPPWWRDRLPVLRDPAGVVVWVGGLGASVDSAAADGLSGWIVRWEPSPDAHGALGLDS
ncbi:MAG: tRNA lysidine(34) synthetase TilS [Rhodocyclaceae bacterium]